VQQSVVASFSPWTDLSSSCGVPWLTGGDEISLFLFHSPRLPAYRTRADTHTHVGAYSSTSYGIIPCPSTSVHILSDAPNKPFLWLFCSRVSWIDNRIALLTRLAHTHIPRLSPLTHSLSHAGALVRYYIPRLHPS